ncbi:transposase, partial [Brevibacterium otitidis]
MEPAQGGAPGPGRPHHPDNQNQRNPANYLTRDTRIDAGEIELTGDGGMISVLIREALERGLQAEMTSHLGYEAGDRAGKAVTSKPVNARNGSYTKTVASQVGDIDISVPRDRAGSFEPVLVPKGSRKLGGLDDMIVSLYAGGMTVRDIQHHLASTIGTELSHETIANITDAVLDAVMEW